MDTIGQDKIMIKGEIPLRGKVSLQSSPYLTNFFITLALFCGSDITLKGSFFDNLVQKYIRSLDASGLTLRNYADTLLIPRTVDFWRSTYISELDSINKYIFLVSLKKQGFAEIKENAELVDFFRYLGYVIEDSKERYIVYNKVKLNKNSITFYKPNLEYFLISILVFLLNYDTFTISISDLNYEMSLLLEDFKNLKIVKDITYSNFVNIHFDVKDLEKKLGAEVVIPRDPNEFIFFCAASMATGGEVEIVGVNPKTFSSSLKLFTDMGAGYDALSTDTIRVWGTKRDSLNGISVLDQSTCLNFTKLCLLPIISVAKKSNEDYFKIFLNYEENKSLIQDLNRLGASLNIEEDTIIAREVGQIKSDTLYLEKGKEESNYVKVLAGLLCKERMEFFDSKHLRIYNSSVFDKLQVLGAEINGL